MRFMPGNIVNSALAGDACARQRPGFLLTVSGQFVLYRIQRMRVQARMILGGRFRSSRLHGRCPSNEPSEDSTDAVNGSQLHATNQAVNRLDGRVTNINNGSTGMFQVSGDNTVAPSPTGTNSAGGGANAIASGDDSVAIGAGPVARPPTRCRWARSAASAPLPTSPPASTTPMRSTFRS